MGILQASPQDAVLTAICPSYCVAFRWSFSSWWPTSSTNNAYSVPCAARYIGIMKAAG
ncbi:hypothetical protein IMZ48_08075 [Candidatus Bathyarchaeota archaeon]|nr:hypothetical protein [Candidatus Bathyarchaeota archaeon]